MKKILINGLGENEVNILLTFMESKLTDKKYIRSIEMGGNPCDMDWIENDMDISGDDMVHELFELYGEENDEHYVLNINGNIFETCKQGENWDDIF